MQHLTNSQVEALDYLWRLIDTYSSALCLRTRNEKNLRLLLEQRDAARDAIEKMKIPRDHPMLAPVQLPD